MTDLNRNPRAGKATTLSPGGVRIGDATQATTPAGRALEDLALQWFGRMRSGSIDRTQLASEYDRHLTDEAVKTMSQHLSAYAYAETPLYASLLRSEARGAQTFHVVKIAFPRGDAASLMFGFNKGGKITGIALLSMAGD